MFAALEIISNCILAVICSIYTYAAQGNSGKMYLENITKGQGDRAARWGCIIWAQVYDIVPIRARNNADNVYYNAIQGVIVGANNFLSQFIDIFEILRFRKTIIFQIIIYRYRCTIILSQYLRPNYESHHAIAVIPYNYYSMSFFYFTDLGILDERQKFGSVMSAIGEFHIDCKIIFTNKQ